MRTLLLTLALLAPAASAQSVVGETGAALDAYLTEAGFSGAVVATRDGAVVLREGYGEAAPGAPNTPETAIQIGSVAKPFTAALVLSLVDDGRLDLAAPLARYLDGLPADKAGITLHHLLTHTAGLPDAIGDDFEAIDREAYVARAFATPLDRAPGAGYAYSNVGFALLAAVVETVTGQSYDAALQAFLGEAGIERTGYRLAPSVPIAHGHDGDRDLGPPTDQRWAPDGPYWNLRGNGGLLSTADDLLAFTEALDAGALLSEEILLLAMTPHTDEGEGSGSHYGYGWALFESPHGRLVTHNGGDSGSSADLLWFVDAGVTLAVLSNDRAVEAYDVSGALAEILFGGEPEPFEAGGAVAVPVEALASRVEGQRALAFVEAVNARTEAAARAFVEAHLDEGFRQDPDGMVGFFDAVRQEVGNAPITLSRAEADPDEGMLILYADLADGGVYRIELGFDGPPEHRIAGLFTEVVDPDRAAAECPAPRLPDDAFGERATALLAALCDGSPESLRAFIDAHVDPPLVDAAGGADALVAGLGRLAGEVGGGEVAGMRLASATEGTLAIEGRGDVLRVSLRLADAPPHRIAAIDVEAGPDGPAFASVEAGLADIAAEAEAGRFSGVVLIAKDGEPVVERAFGWADRARGERVTPETRFNVGSINKELTAVAVLQLAARGAVDLDAPIGAVLDGFPEGIADAVTVRHLLQHRSGWGHYWDHPVFVAREAELTEIGDYLAFIRTIPLDFAPGAREQYSNVGYEVLGAIVEAASGQRYADYVAAHVTGPAAMTDARTATHGAPGHATPYLGAGYGRPAPIAKHGTAAGGGYATARDLLRFQAALTDGRLLTREMRNLLFNRFEPTDAEIEPSMGIAGGAPGINAVWEWDAPSGWSVVVVANREPPTAEALGLALMRAATD
ncbi:serine hydrolase domain-containing protein [Rubrivirga sp. IMCC45206]|uniref:serine hydrolase domain-containing protein n=1 Tax=Rubrivirga sp. IMCC45206 TaxID=3391614 RepID=UPI00398FDE40